MRRVIMVVMLVLAVGTGGTAWGATPYRSDADLQSEVKRGVEEILDLWRVENYEGLFARLDRPASQGWSYFAQRIVYGSRLPACCWEKLQDVKVRVIDADHVVISARVGFEVEGVGTRFVERDFPLHRSDGVWRLPMA